MFFQDKGDFCWGKPVGKNITLVHTGGGERTHFCCKLIWSSQGSHDTTTRLRTQGGWGLQRFLVPNLVPLSTGSCENPEDPYRVVFHPVVADARVHFPPHVKRFEAYMFSFAEDALEPSGQVTKFTQQSLLVNFVWVAIIPLKKKK